MPLTNALLLSKALDIESTIIIEWCQSKGFDIEGDKSWIEAKQANIIREYFTPEVIEARKKITPLLENYEFEKADRQFANTGEFLAALYKELKEKYIIKYFSKHLKVSIDSEKAKALANMSPNLLVTARAGSGKTRLLVCKTALLIDKYHFDPDKILLLAFNKKAAREMQKRIVKDFKIDNFRNAKTFHSLAYKLVKPKQKILYDKSDEDFAGDLSLFVKNILRDIWNPAFREIMLQLFRKEMKDIERRGDLLDEGDYYIFRRSMIDITLKGDRVKSMGEKFIADFLFEHDIEYAYEAGYFWKKDETYRPDFKLYENQEDIVIEHWAIDPNSTVGSLPDHWTKTANEYRAEMQRKKDWLKWKDIRLIETSVADLRSNSTVDTRMNFENMLRP